MAAPPLGTGVIPEKVERAVNALLEWRAAKSQTQKPQLLEQDEFVYLVVSLKKIPQKGVGRIKPYKIRVPHSLATPQNGSSELCLIVDDRPKSGLTKEAAKKKIDSEGIPISKILRLSKLKTDYRPFEAKRKLCDSYDLFLADRRVIPLLPKMLGKEFFRKKKIPVPVNLKHKNWKEQIVHACGSALVFLRTGTCSVVKAARISMQKDEILGNVVATINGIVEEIVPKKWRGVRSLHLKLLDSLSLPVYEAIPDLKLKIESRKVEEEEDEVVVVEKENVEERKVGKKKGRIREIRYMDSNVDAFDGEELGSDGEVDSDDDKAELGSGKLVVKRRKKGIKGQDERRAKKLAKVKRGDGAKRKKEVDKVKHENDVNLKKRKKKIAAAE